MLVVVKQILATCLIMTAAALFADHPPAYAARLLAAEVEVDGKLVLRASYTDSGAENGPTVWRYLAGEPGWAETAKIQPDEADPQRAHLKGNIVIRIQHVDRPIVQASASELALVRIGSPGDRWFLPEAEVERIAADNGIPPPTVVHSPRATLGLAIAGGLALLGLALVLLVFVLWPRPRTAL